MVPLVRDSSSTNAADMDPSLCLSVVFAVFIVVVAAGVFYLDLRGDELVTVHRTLRLNVIACLNIPCREHAMSMADDRVRSGDNGDAVHGERVTISGRDEPNDLCFVAAPLTIVVGWFLVATVALAVPTLRERVSSPALDAVAALSPPTSLSSALELRVLEGPLDDSSRFPFPHPTVSIAAATATTSRCGPADRTIFGIPQLLSTPATWGEPDATVDR